MQPCAINPKTGKPYSKHKYTSKNGRVVSYDGAGRPMRYAYEVECTRCDRKLGTVEY